VTVTLVSLTRSKAISIAAFSLEGSSSEDVPPPAASGIRGSTMVQRQHDLTKALEKAMRSRKGADTRWRTAIAEALAAGVTT
jgi:hypothetical protein